MIFQNYSPSRLLLPVLLLSLTFVGFLGFQTNLLLGERAALKVGYGEQGKALEQVEKVRTQASGLVKGVLDLSKKGNKNAKNIVNDLKKAGIDLQDQPPPAAAGTTAPGTAAAPSMLQTPPAMPELPKR